MGPALAEGKTLTVKTVIGQGEFPLEFSIGKPEQGLGMIQIPAGRIDQGADRFQKANHWIGGHGNGDGPGNGILAGSVFGLNLEHGRIGSGLHIPSRPISSVPVKRDISGITTENLAGQGDGPMDYALGRGSNGGSDGCILTRIQIDLGWGGAVVIDLGGTRYRGGRTAPCADLGRISQVMKTLFASIRAFGFYACQSFGTAFTFTQSPVARDRARQGMTKGTGGKGISKFSVTIKIQFQDLIGAIFKLSSGTAP